MFKSTLDKMSTENTQPVSYYLNLGTDFVVMNHLIGKSITFTYLKNSCLNCEENSPLYRMGFCKRCFFESPMASESIIRPELSKAHLDIEVRDLEFEKKLELQPHIVYLSISSNLKVGVTRKSQIPTRWIDQGAEKAIVLVEVPNRYLAGITEVALKNHFDDKTNWRKMLTASAPEIDLVTVKKEAENYLPDEVKQYIDSSNFIHKIQFPIDTYFQKIKSLNVEKEGSFTKTLQAIKGQYLIFDDASVLNVRSMGGMVVEFKVN